jgi:hypothetical protein
MNMKNFNKVRDEIEYSAQDVSERTGIPYDKIIRFLSKGFIQARQPGKAYIIPGREVMDIITGKNEAVMKSLGIESIPILESFDFDNITINTKPDVINKCGIKHFKKIEFKRPTQWSDVEWRLYLTKRHAWLRKKCIKLMAQEAVKKARREGKLNKPQKCTFCSSEGKLDAHHWSYEPEHWLNVIWCCVSCHRYWHSSNTPKFPMWTVIDIEF